MNKKYNDITKINSINCKLPDDTDVNYVNIVEVNRKELDRLFLSKNIDDVCYAILSTCYYQDYEFCIEVCKSFLFKSHSNKIISTVFNGICVMCNRFKYIEHEFLNTIINIGLNNSDEFIYQCAQNLLDDTHLIKGYKFKPKNNLFTLK